MIETKHTGRLVNGLIGTTFLPLRHTTASRPGYTRKESEVGLIEQAKCKQTRGSEHDIEWPVEIPAEALAEVEGLSFVSQAGFLDRANTMLRVGLSPTALWTATMAPQIYTILERHTTPAPEPGQGCEDNERRIAQARTFATAALAQIGCAEARLRTAAGDARSIENILSGPGDTKS